MPSPQLQQIVRRIVALAESERPERTDAELLRAFLTNQNSTAFSEIIQRHGGLVMAVCRRVLGDHPAVDDAWQATFLILARRASSVRSNKSLAGWLHSVAYRTALNERRSALRRATHESAAEPPMVLTPDRQAAFREIQAIVDAEVQRLPSHLREVFIRCALENECRADVAACLALNEGTVRSRLSAARRLMGNRLKRRGIELSVALALAAATTTRVAAALSEATVQAAVCVAAHGVKRAMISSHVAALVAGSAHGFVFARLAALIIVLAVGVVGLGLSLAPPDAKEPTPKNESPTPPTPDAKQMVEADPLPTGALARFGTTRFRTGSMVSRLIFSPSGKQLASLCSDTDDQFSMWEAHTGKELWTVRTKMQSMLAMSWPSEENGFAVLATGELWDFTAEKRAKLPEPGPDVRPMGMAPIRLLLDAATISPDGKWLAAAKVVVEEGEPQSIAIYEVKPAKTIGDLKVVVQCESIKAECAKLALTPDGKRLVGVCPVAKDGKPSEGGQLVVWTKDGKIERTLDAPKSAHGWDGFHLQVSNGSAALGMSDGDTFVVALDTGKTRTFPTGHKEKKSASVFAVAFSPDEKTLATVGIDGMVRLSDMATGKVTREFGPHRSWPQAVAFNADGTRLVSGGQDTLLRVWDTVTGKEAVPTGGHAYRVWRVSASADGRTIATEGGDHKLYIWDAATGIERRQIDAGGNVNFSRLTPDAKQIIAIVGPYDEPKTLKVWDVATGKDATPRGFPQPLPARGFHFTYDGKTLLTFDEDRLAAWTWPGGMPIWTADMPKPANQPGINRIDSISVSPDGKQFITVAERYWYRLENGLKYGYAADGVIDLWDTATGKRICQLAFSEGGTFRPAVYAADGMLIHSGGGFLPTAGLNGKPEALPRQISVIDPLTGRLVRSFASLDKRARSGYAAALSADGKALFRATQDGGLHVFEVATGQFRMSCSGHLSEVLALDAPAADVRRVVTGSLDTTALLWDVGFDGKKSAPIAEADRNKLWEALANPDAAAAYATMTKLAGDPSALVALANERLKPAPASPTEDALAPIVRDLDSPRFATREAASSQLDKYGESAIPLVRAELEKTKSPEVKERLIKYLNRHDGPREDRLTQIRAVELLEHLGTAECKEVLKKLASGGSSRMTSDAASALKRLELRR